MIASRARFWLAAIVIAAAAALDAAPDPDTALAAYVADADATYGWSVRDIGEIDGAQYVELLLTSQTWRDQRWRHQLFIIRPATIEPGTRHAILFVSGGRWRDSYAAPPGDRHLPSSAQVYVRLAAAARAPLAILRQVPFQPIFDGLTEDDAIAYTFDRYLESGDASWPLLLPMVKSAVRAMDAVQEYSREAWSLELEDFTVTGASKRGWTTWLTGAVDPRVRAIAPMVIDVLNMPAQMNLAREVWGALSEQIAPYTERGIDTRLETEAGQALLEIVDPWRYRSRLALSKLVILGTNDAYWPLEAASVYWDELPGEKRLLYVPNEGHDIDDYDRLLGGIVALHASATQNAPLPALEWEFEERTDGLMLAVVPSEQPHVLRGWLARSATRDFRGAHWRRIHAREREGTYSISLTRDRRQYLAVFAEAVYREDRAVPFYLSTGVRILEPRNVQ